MTVLALVGAVLWRLTGHGAIIPRDGSWDALFISGLIGAVALDQVLLWTWMRR